VPGFVKICHIILEISR